MYSQVFTEAECYSIYDAIDVRNCTSDKQQTIENSIFLVAEYTCHKAMGNATKCPAQVSDRRFETVGVQFFRIKWASVFRQRTQPPFHEFHVII